jgi:hypothetical protein
LQRHLDDIGIPHNDRMNWALVRYACNDIEEEIMAGINKLCITKINFLLLLMGYFTCKFRSLGGILAKG